MRQWRLIYDCPTPGSHHMAVDDALLRSVVGQPTLRLYAWAPFCLSLGYGQRAGDVDEMRLSEWGWDLVRRPSGGRAILHAEELTYSLVLPMSHPLAAGDVITSYRRISQALVRGLEFVGLQPEADRRAGRVSGGPVCFDTPSHYEITWQGRKLIGSAQLRRQAGILQHGSLPLRGDLARICDILRYPDEAAREAARQHVRAHSSTLNQALSGSSPNWQVVARAITEGFREVFKIEFETSELTPEERELAFQLKRDVYNQPGWTFRR
ncbi:MAG: lipoate--protein ligase family protein [Anaerolineae bacterium]|nr:lipoate--protein ligase family protein [Anaerolineae bacterium]